MEWSVLREFRTEHESVVAQMGALSEALHALAVNGHTTAGPEVAPVLARAEGLRHAFLVHRLAEEHPDQTIRSLQHNVCPCATMNRIDPAHLLWCLEQLVAGHVVNAVRVPDAVRAGARLALDRMLSLKGSGALAAHDMAKD